MRQLETEPPPLDTLGSTRVSLADGVRGPPDVSPPPTVIAAIDDEDLPVLRTDDHLRSRLLAGGARVGRFTVVRQLEQGGMSLIFVARDDELDRLVALKLLRTHAADALGRSGLLREAQALARLSHPNVVTVHEVGEFEGHVFVAMELVEGRTLGAWIRMRRRSWREVVGVFVQAGRGLAAAHAAGIIHRDFKPANVLVGDDGRVRVVDFGLARAPGGGLHGGAPTLAGTVVGTPAYMAPEQLVAGELDHRADQYAFCVTLAEALHGARPYKGRTVGERLKALHDRPAPDLPRGRKVPAFLRVALLRGLDADPARRFPSMAELLDAIDRDPVRRRLQIAAGVALGLAMVLVGFLLARSAPAGSCEGIEALWNDERRGAARAAIEATGVHHAATTWGLLAPRLDAYATEWRDLRRSTCVAHSRGERTDELHGRQLVCLQRRRAAFDALIDSLLAADAAVVQKAARAVDELPELAACDDVAALTTAIAPPDAPAVAGAIERLRDQLEPARVALSLRKAQAGLAIVAPIQARARELGYLPFEAEVHLLAGRLYVDATDFEAGERALTDALWLADQTGDDELLAGAMAHLIFMISHYRGRHEEALRWRRHADSVRARLPPGSVGGAVLLHNLGLVHLARAEVDEALVMIEEALKLREARDGPEDPRLANFVNSLGAVHFQRGDLAEARSHFERALALQEAALGPDHPDLASPLSNLGAVLGAPGDFEGSLVYFRRSLAILEASIGDMHPSLAPSLMNIGATLGNQGDYAGARSYFERVLAIRERAQGPEHPEVADALVKLGETSMATGDRSAARSFLRRALAIQQKTLPAGHPDLVESLVDLGRLELEDGRPKAALGHLERALALITARSDIAQVERLALARYWLARALGELGRSAERQRELAEGALAGFGELAPRFQEEREWCERLLAEAPPAPKKRGKRSKRKTKKKR